ncbi:hypothetical protein DL770_010398 [Monosporascus sp. CRB-9-2]|nr:hypothetical protein DL770_010398 [Monosporascus sp. CRB-9-2]
MTLKSRAGSFEPDPREFSHLPEQNPTAGYGPSEAVSAYSGNRFAAAGARLSSPLTEWTHRQEGRERMEAWNKTSAGTSSAGTSSAGASSAGASSAGTSSTGTSSVGTSSFEAVSRYIHSDERLAASLAGLLPPLTVWAHQKEGLERIEAWNKTWQSASSGRRDGPLSSGGEDEAASAESTSADRRAWAKNSPEEDVTVPAAEQEGLALPDTRPSEAQPQGPRRLTAEEKSRFVEAVRNYLCCRISDVLGAATRGAAGGEQSNPSSTSSQMRAVPSSQQRPNGTGKRKGHQRGEGSGDDSDAGGRGKRHKTHPEPSPGVIRDKFACPFFKRDPQLYGPESDCASHSWEIRRLKEHLRRRHLPLFECDRCLGGFCSEPKLAAHRRNCATPAKGGGERPAQLAQQKWGRIMDTQLFRGKSDHAKWLAIFEILYPEVPREGYPSPYHDHNPVENFVHFALQQTPLHLPAELGQRVFVIGGEDARDCVTEVVRAVLRSVYDIYPDSQRLTSPTTLRAPNSLTSEPVNHLSDGQAASETASAPIAPGVQSCVEAFLSSGFVDEGITRLLPGQTVPYSLNFEEETRPPFDGLSQTADSGLGGSLGFEGGHTPVLDFEFDSGFLGSRSPMEAEGEPFAKDACANGKSCEASINECTPSAPSEKG